MLVLKFNAKAMYDDFAKELVSAANEIMDSFYRDVTSELKAQDHEIDKAVFDNAKDEIIAQCKFHAQSILESYGTGEKMDTSYEEFDEIFSKYQKSDLWNPLRSGKPIVGRAPGEYTNFLGEKKESTGSRAGQFVSNGRVARKIIQNAEKRLKEQSYSKTILKEHTESFFANLYKYFKNESV